MTLDDGVRCCLDGKPYGYSDKRADEQGDGRQSVAERSRANDSHWSDDLSSKSKDERDEVQANLRRVLKW